MTKPLQDLPSTNKSSNYRNIVVGAHTKAPTTPSKALEVNNENLAPQRDMSLVDSRIRAQSKYLTTIVGDAAIVSMQAANAYVPKQHDNPVMRFAFGSDSFFWKKTFNPRVVSGWCSDPSKKAYCIKMAWRGIKQGKFGKSKVSQKYPTPEEAEMQCLRFRLMQEFTSDQMVKRYLIDYNSIDEIEHDIRLVLSKYDPVNTDDEVMQNLARIRQGQKPLATGSGKTACNDGWNENVKKPLLLSKKRKYALSYPCPLRNPNSIGGFNFIGLSADRTTIRLGAHARSIQEGGENNNGDVVDVARGA